MAMIDAILERVNDLPALPTTAVRLISAINGGNAEFDEIERIIRLDESLAMTVMRYGNSAQFGVSGRTFSLRECLVRLGSKGLMKIALQARMSSVLDHAGASYGLRRGALWRGALGGALIAEQIGRANAHPDPELCFLCGLFRDVGKTVMDLFAEPEQVFEAAASIDSTCSFLEAEIKAFGASHAQIGSALARKWELPDQIANAILHHHDPPPPDDAEHDELFDIVHAADVVCLWAGLATGADGLQYPLSPHVRDGLLVSRRNAEAYITDMWGKLTEAEDAVREDHSQERSA
jgi:HD-like signal output (HDOD) protein